MNRKIVIAAALVLSFLVWPNVSWCETPTNSAMPSANSPASLFFASATFTDASGKNSKYFAQPVGPYNGSNAPGDGYIIDPYKNNVNLVVTLYNGKSSFGYKKGNVKIFWDFVPLGYASASDFMKAVKVSGTKGKTGVENGLYVWTSKNKIKPGKTASVRFQFPMRTTNGTTIKTIGTLPQTLGSPPIQLFNQAWHFTASITGQQSNLSSTLDLYGTITLEQSMLTMQTSGCIQPNPNSSPNPVGGPVSLSYLVYPTYANTGKPQDAIANFSFKDQNGQSPICQGGNNNYNIPAINTNFTYSAIYQCDTCWCPDCGEVCSSPDDGPVQCRSAIKDWNNQKCHFQNYKNSLPGTFTFSGGSTTGYPLTDAYCCPTLPE